MSDRIDDTINYYAKKRDEILNLVNSKNDLTADQIIQYGEEMAIIEYKMTALEIANEN